MPPPPPPFSSPLTRSARRQLLSPVPLPADAPATTATAAAADEGGSSVLKRADREQLIQEYAAYQNGLAPTKRRRASRALLTTSSAAESDALAEEPAASSGREVEQEGEAEAAEATETSERESEEATLAIAVSTPGPAAAPAVAVATLSSEEKRLDGAPEGELFLVSVLTRDELQPSADVDAESVELEALLALRAESGESESAESAVSWGKAYYAVDSVRRFAIHHPEHLKQHLDKALPLLVCPAVSSLRSAMSRNALLCIQDVILCLQDAAASSFDAVVPLLLTRASSEKQFIRDLAREVLDTAVEHCASEALLLNLLRTSAGEKNPQAVNVIGLYVHKCITRMDSAVFQEFVLETHEAFVQEMTALLGCKVVECKVATRKSLQHTRKVVGDAKFVALVKRKLSDSAQFDVLKASESKQQAAKPAASKLSMRERMQQMRKQKQQQQQRPSDASDVVVAAPAPAPTTTTTTTTAAASS